MLKSQARTRARSSQTSRPGTRGPELRTRVSSWNFQVESIAVSKIGFQVQASLLPDGRLECAKALPLSYRAQMVSTNNFIDADPTESRPGLPSIPTLPFSLDVPCTP